MSEVIEHQLCLNHGNMVVVTRPYFGNQSDSFSGQLLANTEEYPIRFQFVGAGMATVFTVDDVKSIEEPNQNCDQRAELIINLKGPHDYELEFKSSV